jgi:hypothetical protein
MKVGGDVARSCDRFVGALASTRLPDVSTRQELAAATLKDSGITRMLEDFAGSYGWVPTEEMRQIHTKKGPEDMLWLWCMHSLWTDANCGDLLATTCRPGWPLKTNGERFRTWLSYEGSTQRADVACFLGSVAHPDHAVFCELAFVHGAPSRPEDHKDYTKITRLSTRLPVTHVLIDGTLSPRAVASRTDFRLSSGEQAAYLVVTR